MNEDLDQQNQPPIDPEPQDVATDTPADVPAAAPSDSVTINRADYDRLAEAERTVGELKPFADLLKADPGFADRLRNAAAAPVNTPPSPDFTQYNDTFYNDPALSTAEIADKVIAAKYAPQIAAQARTFQLQFNRMAIENFRASKRGSDSFASGILPIFDQTIGKTTDDELAAMDANRLNGALQIAYDMAAGQYLRSRAGATPKDQPPPIAAGGIGGQAGARGGVEPDSDEYRVLMAQAAALKISPEKVREMWKAAEEEERRGIA